MGKTIDWMKANPLTVLSGVMAVAAIGLFVWVYMERSALVARAANEPSRTLNEIQQLNRTRIEVPGLRPDDPPEEFHLVANAGIRDALRSQYRRMESEARLVEALTSIINQTGPIGPVYAAFDQLQRDPDLARRMADQEDPRSWLKDRLLDEAARHGARIRRPMLDRLFTATRGQLGIEADDAARARAPLLYRDELRNMLSGGNNPNPRSDLRAGAPVSTERMAERIEKDKRFFLNNRLQFPKTLDQLDESERESLRASLRHSISDELRENAKNIGLYVGSINPTSDRFPMPAALPDDPTPSDVWYAQLDLWMYEDMINAIRIANRLDDQESNVINRPVKRLVRMSAVPGYVGVGDRAQRDEWRGPGGDAGQTAATGPQYVRPGTAPLRLPTDFEATATGRVSVGRTRTDATPLVNPLFDVRHLEVELIVDARYLTDLLEAIGQVNLMTPIKMNIRQVDEYESIRRGYWFGEADCIRVEMTIETIWLRDWIVPEPDQRDVGFMPLDVRRSLGIVRRQD
ncbi:MAG: hypothetical protein JJU36_14060 [Phycisphaeraceae bacterium]|nr:hypothetical protein [Phycisphaeraceae bacterium]